jgi:SH3-like domain-containing protein
MKVFQLQVLKRIFYFMSIIVFTSVLITFTKNIWDQNNKFAIIVSEESIMYSAPFLNQGIQQSIFYNGNKVKIHQKTDSWIEVSAYDGRKGWIRASDVRNLN